MTAENSSNAPTYAKKERTYRLVKDLYKDQVTS